jgi:hypothetical protein
MRKESTMKFTRYLAPLALATSAIAATPAAAAVPACTANLDSFSQTASSCSGWFAGNLLSGNSGDVTAQTDALASLGYDFTSWGDYDPDFKIDTNGSGVFDFGTVLSGPTIIGIHFGAGKGGPGVGVRGGVTGFFLFDLGTPVDSITTALKGSSGAVLYSTGSTSAVPEPGTWAMMLIGFGAIGFSLRSSNQRRKLLTQAA